MSNDKYILLPDGTVEQADLLTWAKWFEASGKTERRIAETDLPDGRWVSTVFLGLDHSFGGGVPILFETMVFPSKDDMGELECERYGTKAEAEAGHARIVAECLSGQHAAVRS